MIIVEKKTLDTLANKIQGINMRDVRIAHAIGNVLTRSTRERIIKSKKSPKNHEWKPRSQATLELLEKAKANGKITDIGTLLHLEGTLANIGYSTARFHYNGEVSMRSKAKYSGYIQDGTSKMPARPFLGLSSADYKSVRALLIRHAVKQIEEGVW